MHEPLSNNATAQARSFSGNHSDTALVEPGLFAASPHPRRKRKLQKLASPWTVVVSIWITE